MKKWLFVVTLLLVGCGSTTPKKYCDKTYKRDLRDCNSNCKEYDNICKVDCDIKIEFAHCISY